MGTLVAEKGLDLGEIDAVVVAAQFFLWHPTEPRSRPDCAAGAPRRWGARLPLGGDHPSGPFGLRTCEWEELGMTAMRPQV